MYIPKDYNPKEEPKKLDSLFINFSSYLMLKKIRQENKELKQKLKDAETLLEQFGIPKE